jgi:hypothetical protein
MNPMYHSFYRHYRLARHSLDISLDVSKKILVTTADVVFVVLSKISKLY